jgi:1,4-dihydroxy-2-naphthoyl-CoA synthase
LDDGMTELVHLDVAGGVATITLDSPHNKNALSQQLTGELLEQLEAAGADDAVRVIVVRSALDVFCGWPGRCAPAVSASWRPRTSAWPARARRSR